MNRMMHVLDHVEWDPRTTLEIRAEIVQAHPSWLRTANFYERSLAILRDIPPPQLVLWRVEFWGADRRFPQVPSTGGTDPARYARDLFALGHQVVPYTYVEWNRAFLVDLVPSLAERPFHVIPVAQKPAVTALGRVGVRQALGLPPDALVYGVGGLNHPAKRINEVVAGFARSRPDPNRWLLVSLVDEDDQAAEEIAEQWKAEFPGDLSQVRIRVGRYGDWEWMCGFYQAVDALLINSLCESWCRMASEAMGFGVPLLVRRAPCASNHLAPDTVLVDDFEDFDSERFGTAIDKARQRAGHLQRYARDHYGLSVVRELTLRILRESSSPSDHAVFDILAADPDQLALLDTVIAY